jgi:phasin family protein
VQQSAGSLAEFAGTLPLGQITFTASSISFKTSKPVHGPHSAKRNGTYMDRWACGASGLATERQDTFSINSIKGKTMFNTPEQLIAAHKAALETMQAVAMKSIEGFERLVELNLQATKDALSEGNEQVVALLSAKDAKAVADLTTQGVQPATDKAAAYAKSVYDIARETSAEIAKIYEAQMSEVNKQVFTTIESMAKNAPAGSEGVVSFVKSAMAASNSAWDQVNKTTRQVVEMAEANVAAVAKAPRARKAA